MSPVEPKHSRSGQGGGSSNGDRERTVRREEESQQGVPAKILRLGRLRL